MTLSIIAAVGKHTRALGKNGGLLWHIPGDLPRFKRLTMGKPIIMGRKTFDSIGKALPGRTNIIVSRNPSLSIEGCLVCQSLEEALRTAQQITSGEIFVIGGAVLFERALPLAERLYLTVVDDGAEGDVFFPPFDSTKWTVTKAEKFPKDGSNPFAYEFIIYTKNVTR